MTPLETKVVALLVECEGIIKPYILTAEKWVIINKTLRQTKTVIDEKTSIAISYSNSSEKIKKLKSYIVANTAFGRDKAFAKADKAAGVWGTFDGVLQYMLTSTCKVTATKILFDHTKAISKLRQLRETFTKKHIRYIATTRLIGATTTAKITNLPDEVEIVRLTQKEQNNKQPLIQRYYQVGLHDIGLTDSSLELNLPITVPVDHSQEGAFFRAHNDAVQSARNIFVNILDSILVAISGKAMLGSIELHGGIEQMPVGQHIPQERPPHTNITISKKDISNISTAYDLISGGKKGDKTLSRALHRFLLGRKRPNLIDKLVDYVISWEALLLTQNGSPITQELSYRFSLNGAAILAATDKKLDRFKVHNKMKVAYSLRSTIVHGGGDNDIEKELKKGNFDDLQSLCDFLEVNFRNTIIWLAKKDVKDRPYRKPNGWEKLIWLG